MEVSLAEIAYAHNPKEVRNDTKNFRDNWTYYKIKEPIDDHIFYEDSASRLESISLCIVKVETIPFVMFKIHIPMRKG